MVLKVLLIFALIKCAFCDEALLEPCLHADVECLNIAMESFLTKTGAGIPQYGIQALHPLQIHHVEYADPDSDIVMHFRNINVTGLRDMKMNHFQMDIDKKSVVLQTRIDTNIVADLSIEMKEAAKFLSGTYTAKANVLGTANYNYDVKTNDQGMEYFEVGPETITCEAVNEPEVTLDPQFVETITNDPDAIARRADYQKRASEIRKRAACRIITEAYGVVISNLRSAAKILPKTAFFKDL